MPTARIVHTFELWPRRVGHPKKADEERADRFHKDVAKRTFTASRGNSYALY